MSSKQHGEVIPFPGYEQTHQGDELPPDGPRQVGLIERIGSFMLRIIRRVCFYVMLWMRGLVRGCAMLISFVTLFIVVAGLIMTPDRTDMIYPCIGISFGAFMFGALYDEVLMWLSDDGIILDSGRWSVGRG